MDTRLIKSFSSHEDCSSALNRMLAEIPDDSCVLFEHGVYYLRSPLVLRGKRNVILEGSGSILLLHFNPEEDYRSSTDGLHLEGCRQVTIRNFMVRGSAPSNTGGEIIDVSSDHIDLRLFADPPLTGREKILGIVPLDVGHRPNNGCGWANPRSDTSFYPVFGGELHSVAPGLIDPSQPHECLGENQLRIRGTVHDWQLDYYKPGVRVLVKHVDNGLTGMVFKDCEDMVIEDIRMTDFGGMGFIVFPRCRNFTFRNLCIRPSNARVSPYACVLGAINTTGLGGKLLIENCYFEGVGDDILNTHTPVVSIASIQGNSLTLTYKQPAYFPKRWSKPGDILELHDKASIALKARLRILEENGNVISVENAESGKSLGANVGDFIINTVDSPEITIRNCIAVNSRSRFCIAAASKLEMYDNHIDMTPQLAPIYLSSAFAYWGEAGVLQDISIHDNRIFSIPGLQGSPYYDNPPLAKWLREKQKLVDFGPNSQLAPRPAIWIRVNECNIGAHDNLNRYHNIRIYRNRIMGNVIASHVEGLEIHDNVFDALPDDAIWYDGKTCAGVCIENNWLAPEYGGVEKNTGSEA